MSQLARGPLAYKTKTSENRLFNRIDLCQRALTFGIDRTFPTVPTSWTSMEKELERVIYPTASKLNADMDEHFGKMEKLGEGVLRNQHDWYNDERRRVKRNEKKRREREEGKKRSEEEKRQKQPKKLPETKKTNNRDGNAVTNGLAKASFGLQTAPKTAENVLKTADPETPAGSQVAFSENLLHK